MEKCDDPMKNYRVIISDGDTERGTFGEQDSLADRGHVPERCLRPTILRSLQDVALV